VRSTTGEKLIESWLDKQTERRYQPAILQLLTAEGWTILHNTRHTALEYGKDVIARDPHGKLVAIQLKGNPGTRLTKSQAQGMLPQVLELLEVPVPETYMLSPNERHTAVIVTNGEVEEESLLEFEKIGQRTNQPISSADKLEVWGRGNLLARFRSKINNVWPTDIDGIRLVLEYHAKNGQSLVDVKDFSELLRLSVGVPSNETNSPEKNAKVASALLLGEIIKSPWYEAENHYALFQISILISIFCLRYCDSSIRLGVVKSYDNVITGHCLDLISEAQKKEFDAERSWAERSPLEEVDIMKERLRLVADVCATIVLSRCSIDREQSEFITKTLRNSIPSGSVWGEGAIPSLIVRYWAFRNTDATMMPDQLLRGAMYALVNATRGVPPNPPSPYYSFEECLYLYSGGQIGKASDINEDSSRNRSWFSTTILYLLAKRNWKQTCKNVWRTYSKILHVRMDMSVEHFYDAKLVRDGREITTPIYASDWNDLVLEAINNDDPGFPDGFEDRSWIIASYIALVPYRAWVPVVLWLDKNISKTWYDRQNPPRVTE